MTEQHTKDPDMHYDWMSPETRATDVVAVQWTLHDDTGCAQPDNWPSGTTTAFMLCFLTAFTIDTCTGLTKNHAAASPADEDVHAELAKHVPELRQGLDESLDVPRVHALASSSTCTQQKHWLTLTEVLFCAGQACEITVNFWTGCSIGI